MRRYGSVRANTHGTPARLCSYVSGILLVQRGSLGSLGELAPRPEVREENITLVCENGGEVGVSARKSTKAAVKVLTNEKAVESSTSDGFAVLTGT